MKRSILILFIISLFLAACGQSTDNNQVLKDTEQKTTQTTEADDTNTSKEDKNQVDEENTDMNSAASQQTNENDLDTPATNLPDLYVHYIDAGQADATLFQYAEGEKTYNILFDAGDWNNNLVVSYLSEQDIDLIDLIIISHPHADHIGQLPPIIEQFEVGEVWFSGNTSSSKTFQKTVDAVMASNADYEEPRAGETFDVGPLQIEILHPSSLTGALNEDSISARFTYGNVRFLFTGDAYQNEELEMMNRDISVDADILQLGHHGSQTSSHPDFIQAVDPDIAIYSAGEGNAYGHPHADVVSRITSADIDLYGTDVHGTIKVTTDGDSYELTTVSDGTVTPSETANQSSSANSGPNNTLQNKPSHTTEQDTSNESTHHENDETEDHADTSDCVDLNKASFEQVKEIIRIGPARAEDVIEQRPFNSVDDLKT